MQPVTSLPTPLEPQAPESQPPNLYNLDQSVKLPSPLQSSESTPPSQASQQKQPDSFVASFQSPQLSSRNTQMYDTDLNLSNHSLPASGLKYSLDFNPSQISWDLNDTSIWNKDDRSIW
ncbi:hypothetical protein PSN45_002470 [Yamadazyma tenuis]|nr:hypothetical protein PSN45_002470 [Yamadazyma tenuis]